MSSKALLVAQREFVENLRTKAFWIGIFIFPVILTVATVAPILLEKLREERTYAVVDHSGWLLAEVERRAQVPDVGKVLREALGRLRRGGEDFESLPPELRQLTEEIAASLEAMGEGAGARERAEDDLLRFLSQAAAGLAGPEGQELRALLPPEVAQRLDRLEASVRTFWEELPREEAEKLAGESTAGRYRRLELDGDGGGEELLAELNRRVAEGELFAYFVIGENPVEGSEGSRYVSANLTDDDLREWFQALASRAVRDRRLAERQIEPRVAHWIQEPLSFESRKVSAEGAEEEVGTQDLVRQWAPVAFVYLLWVSVLSVSQMLLTNTVEEKSNRIMEVLLSSVSPLQLMAGKILGIAATGLTMVGTWVVFFAGMVTAVPLLLGGELNVNLSQVATDPLYIGSFVLYFLLGYLFYAALLVGIGAVCNSLKEAQNLMTPISILLVIPLISLIFIGKDPNGLLARVMSFIPPFTPFVMMNRAAGPPTSLEYLLTTLVLLAAIAVAFWGAAKIFRIGVLMTGKPPNLPEMLRWLKAPVGAVPERRR